MISKMKLEIRSKANSMARKKKMKEENERYLAMKPDVSFNTPTPETWLDQARQGDRVNQTQLAKHTHLRKY